jgi:hemerythrin
MKHIHKVEVTPGIVWVDVPDADLRILCGCPADAVKHLMRRGLIEQTEVKGVTCETGPNTILLSDVAVQNGQFCNLAEFPVLQMLYRQGMILPNHPNNVGRKPLLLGRREVVDSQMAYIYRGNYGLTSEDEMVNAGATPEMARKMMRLKLRFAFGRIQDPRELLDNLILDDDFPVEIGGGVTVQRIALNLFEVAYKGQAVAVDLNLPVFESYACPYPLGSFQFRREYFAVIHSGEGDGWDINRPAMGSVLAFQGRIYLVDAGPNLASALTALGIGINEIEGIFHTHSHDDHFAGLTTLIQADRRIKYFATPLVRTAVNKKLSALLGLAEAEFGEYFDVVDLISDEWNDIDGLEVRPVFSPHPVETTVFFFRTLSGEGWRSYAHFADVVSLPVLDSMVTDDPNKPGLDRAWFEQIRESYLQPADIKKVDIGGGLIHGDARDFVNDTTGRLILAHTALKLTEEQKRIGSGASFGTVDVLVPSHRDFIWRSAFGFLSDYLSLVSADHIHTLLNGPIRTFNPETILLREDSDHESIFLLLTGQVEVTSIQESYTRTMSAGALMGERSGLWRASSSATYRAISFVQALEIPCELYIAFVRRHNLFREIERLMTRRKFLARTWLCGDIMSNSTLNAIAKSLTEQTIEADCQVEESAEWVGLVESGCLVRCFGDTELERLEPGAFFGEELAVFNVHSGTILMAAETTSILRVRPDLLQSIPNLRWKLFECFERRARVRTALTESRLFEWREAFSVGNEKIDREHRELMTLAGSLVVELRGKKRMNKCKEIIGRLFEKAQAHFNSEETMLGELDVIDANEHRILHQQLIDAAREMSVRVLDGKVSADEVVQYLHKWVVNHILFEDKPFSQALLRRVEHKAFH